MKTNVIYFFALTLLLPGCELLKDANTVDISTDLKSDIPVVVTGKKSSSQAENVNALTFSKSQELSLASNADIEPYLNKIKKISLNSLVITINGLTTGQTINSLSLDVTGAGNVFTKTNITMAANSFTPSITAGILDQVAAKLISDKKITLTVSGNVSGAMTFTVSLNFDTTLTAEVI